MTITLEIPTGTHLPQRDPYPDPFVEIVQCNDCQSITSFWSYPSRICPNCGGHFTSIGTGRWDNSTRQWQVRTKPCNN